MADVIDWEYVKQLICQRIRERYLPKLRQLHDACFEGNALKSLAERCVALYVLYYLDRRRYFATFEEFAAYLHLPPEAEPALRKIWEGGVKVARQKGASKVLGNWLWGVAEDIALSEPTRG
ncbi:hypothetical protein Pogu_0598 [Pyrobaculum oguniense TE7]|uniref:Uncharacterized protein n=1 Tax=Pyrobaculum oguniense (strain DSM 13380 / JCM 10595 / TE7) TaxID=698757 RepID=H6Q7W8_PYROT|nr:hypothetical protein Pogu_0598 [Pyrobaculum oguniense TE7]